MKRISKLNKLFIVIAIFIVIIGLVAYELTGFGYTIARLRCGHKPIHHSSGFKEGNTYITPDNPMYKYSATGGPFNGKFYCTEEQAKADGFHKELTRAEYEKLNLDAQTAKLLQNSPVDFAVYAPKLLPEGISKEPVEVERPDRVRQVLKKQNGAEYGSIIQGRFGGVSGYKRDWLCDDARYPCETIGKTSKGQVVYRTHYPGGNTTVWGIGTEDTFIGISIFGSQTSDGLNDSTVPVVFNSLERVN